VEKIPHRMKKNGINGKEGWVRNFHIFPFSFNFFVWKKFENERGTNMRINNLKNKSHTSIHKNVLNMKNVANGKKNTERIFESRVITNDSSIFPFTNRDNAIFRIPAGVIEVIINALMRKGSKI
jgi:hypothetical protein